MPGLRRGKYLGLVSRHEMLSLLSQAFTSLVLFSSNPNHFDVRSNRFFESLAAGLPVITSNFPKWKEMVDSLQCGLTVDPSSPKDIAEAIIYLVLNADEAARMGRRARQAASEKFNWSHEALKLLSLYKLVLGDSGE